MATFKTKDTDMLVNGDRAIAFSTDGQNWTISRGMPVSSNEGFESAFYAREHDSTPPHTVVLTPTVDAARNDALRSLPRRKTTMRFAAKGPGGGKRPSAPIAESALRLRRLVKRMTGALIVWRARKALYGLSDAALKDIGISRCEIDGLAQRMVDGGLPAWRAARFG